jgi:MscS family membrane protein
MIMKKRIALPFASCLLLAGGISWAQTPPPKPPDTTSPVLDPYDRQTPRKTMLGFLGAAQEGRYGTASHYMQFSPRDPVEKRKILASQLRELLEGGFAREGEISNRPEGSHSDDLADNEEKVGVIQTPAGEVDVVLTRIVDKEAGPIWLFSTPLVARIPDLHRNVGLTTFEEMLPDVLVEKQFFGVALWKWSLALILVPAMLGECTSSSGLFG